MLVVGVTTDGKEQILIGSSYTPLFSEGASIPKHTRRCRRILKHQSIFPAILFLKLRVFWMWTGKSNPASSRSLYFSRIMEAPSSTACDQTIKASSCLSGACFKLLLTDPTYHTPNLVKMLLCIFIWMILWCENDLVNIRNETVFRIGSFSSCWWWAEHTVISWKESFWTLKS